MSGCVLCSGKVPDYVEGEACVRVSECALLLGGEFERDDPAGCDCGEHVEEVRLHADSPDLTRT